MDPLGFALENFDALGRWRTTRRRQRHRRVGRACPTGPAFDGPASLRQRAASTHRDQFVETVTEKLLTYALGRGVEYYDRPAIRQIVRDGAPQRLPLVVDLVLGIVEEPAVPDGAWPMTPAVAGRRRTETRHEEVSGSHDRHEEVAARAGRFSAESAPRWRCRCSTAWFRRLPPCAQAAARGVPAPGRRVRPERHQHAELDARRPRGRSSSRRFSQPLTPFRDRLTVVSGLASTPAMPIGGEGTGDHVRASAAFLTGTHPKKTEGPDIRAGVSMDQIAAGVFGRETQLTSLELCLDSNDLLGACESGGAAPTRTRSRGARRPRRCRWRTTRARCSSVCSATSTTRRPRRVGRAWRAIAACSTRCSPKSSVCRDASGPATAARSISISMRCATSSERIQKTEAQSDRELPTLDKPMGIPATYEEHAKLMFDLQVLAFQTDTTRISTFMMSREVSPRTYPELGISDPHHGLSHHGNNPEKIALLAKVNTFHVRLFAHFLETLQATPDGDGTLLDHTAVLYGCCISDGNQHLHTNLPLLIAGGGCRARSTAAVTSAIGARHR